MLSKASLNAYIEKMRQLNTTAADEMQKFIDTWGMDNMNAAVNYAYGLATKYGEASSSLACVVYDMLAEQQGANVPPAIPAPTATMNETWGAVQGSMNESEKTVAASVGRLVKQAGADTIQQNASRDRAEMAFVPSGDTCAFCIMLASRGWQRVSKNAKPHAAHIHPNCDCQYMVRFSESEGVEGYDPEKYKQIYKDANTDTEGKITYHKDKNGKIKAYKQSASTSRINAIRRMQYAEQEAKEAKGIGKIFANGEEANVYFGQRPPRSLRRENPEEYARQREAYENSTFGKWYSDLSMDQTLSIGEYSGDSYSGINGLLRHEMTEKMVKSWDAVNSKSLDEMIRNIDDAIDSFELEEPIKVFRTCENDVLENLKLEVGTVFHDDGFGSTSVISEKVASGNVVMEINVPPGKGLGAWINPLSGAQDEEFEFLLQRGSDYKVISFENRGDDLVIQLDLLGNSKTQWSYASREEVIEMFRKRGLLDEEGFAIDRI